MTAPPPTLFAGMLVRLATADEILAGTDDRVYVGVFGPRGGREFSLDVRLFDDRERGSDVRYRFGAIWDDGDATHSARLPHEGDGLNAPLTYPVPLDSIDTVYVRKAGARHGDQDDTWRLERVTVTLYGATRPARRRFESVAPLWLGNEYGQQVRLVEVPER